MMRTKELAKLVGERTTGVAEIQRQITLPWGEAVRISFRNVTLRLGRTAITAAGIVLGIAFLVSVWTGKIITEGVERTRAASALSVTQIIEEGGLAPGQEEIEEEKASQAARQVWLVVMSLLVCGVGITNSMLMSVTERFREIGTMKCLGALDEFIVRLFLIESMFLGLLGSLIGVIVGHLTMLLVYGIKEGFSITAMMNWGEMLMYMGIAIVLGALLSLVAAIGPAMRASKMPPAAALATEI